MANEAAIKTALLQTKSLKAEQEHEPPSQLKEDAKWIKKVVEEEQTKPLEVTRDFVINYDKREKEIAESKGRQLENKALPIPSYSLFSSILKSHTYFLFSSTHKITHTHTHNPSLSFFNSFCFCEGTNNVCIEKDTRKESGSKSTHS